MSKPRRGWMAVVIAYRKEETDLHATIESAKESAGYGANIITVEDKTHSGPGFNRHRGIEAASDADAIILVDAHMRFRGDVLNRMGKQVRNQGGLIVPLCHHNESCSFEDSKQPYAGARIVYTCEDEQGKKPLDPKWATSTKPGSRPCVMGACYAFRRDWYYAVGQPLSVLTGWGCDEQLLSVCAWLSGHMPEVIDCHVAHRWRKSPPWSVSERERQEVMVSRSHMINALVPDQIESASIHQWCSLKAQPITANVARVRAALANQPRKWAEWVKLVCGPTEIHGVPQVPVKPVACEVESSATYPIHHGHRAYTPNIYVPRSGIQCPHCGQYHDNPPITNTYNNGRNKRHRCPNPECGGHFISYPHPMQQRCQ